MTALLTSSHIRQLESDFLAAQPKASLMQRAGDAVARLAQPWLKKNSSPAVLVLAGPGNNGGDAWVAAEALRKAKLRVTVLALGEQAWSDPAAKKAHAAFTSHQGEVVKAWPKSADIGLVIDGLFGIGLSKAPSGAFADVIRQCNRDRAAGRCFVLAIDVPSGLDADLGTAFDPAIEADQTVTFIAAKPGLYTADGPDCSGEVIVETLGVPTPATAASLLTREAAAALIPQRRRNSHKGTYGNVAIVGGAEGMTGAAVLAARAALHMGPGKVYLGLFDKDRPPFDLLHPEVMVRDARTLAKDESMSAFAIGMGMGETGAASLLAALSLDKPMVIDADALTAIATNPSIRAAFEAKKAENGRPFLPFIFTPHPGEAAVLLGRGSADVQASRVATALEIAQAFGCVTVLKGSGSIVAAPDGNYVINTTGNPGMASGGTGDALSGMLAALLAIGLDAWDAARLGVYLHGAAGDAALHHGMGPHGLTASEIIFEARTLLNSNLDDHHNDDMEE
jgi:hydroxyethylthiazole kinase-like uncharacterized protein yjeF